MTTTSASILAATDHSAHARHAAERAALIAHDTRSTLSLLHVMAGDALTQVRSWLGTGTEVEARLREDALSQLDDLAQRLQQQRQLQAEVLLKDGPLLDTMLAEADRLDARLLVVGARGAGFMRRLVLGSTAERLLRRTTRPVLVVRQMPHEPYRRVLVALDFSPWSQATLALARWVAPHAQLVLANVFEVPYEDKLRLAGVDDARIAQYRDLARAQATRRLHELAAQAGLQAGQWQSCVVEGDASFRLIEKEQELDCDLTALGKHGSSMTADFLLGSVTHHLLAEGAADVLVSTRHGD